MQYNHPEFIIGKFRVVALTRTTLEGDGNDIALAIFNAHNNKPVKINVVPFARNVASVRRADDDDSQTNAPPEEKTGEPILMLLEPAEITQVTFGGKSVWIGEARGYYGDYILTSNEAYTVVSSGLNWYIFPTAKVKLNQQPVNKTA